MRIMVVLWVGLLLSGLAARGQSFAYRAALGAVPADSFYRVLLPPAITAHLQPGFADLRLYDQQHRQVPYLLEREAPGPSTQDARYLPVPGLRFRQHGNLPRQKTILRFSAPRPVLIDQLVFTIAAPALYYRQATLYQRREPRRRSRRARDYEPVTQFVLAANQDNTLRLDSFHSRDFYVEIQNGDSPPLVIDKVRAYQLPTYLVAALEKGKSYYLAFGSRQPLPPPAYDLPYFRDRIPRQLPTLRPGNIQSVTRRPQAGGSLLQALLNSPYLLWAALLAVIAWLAYMTYKLVQEAGKPR